MVPSKLNSLINFYCFGSTAASGDSQFPQADKLILINSFKDVFASAITEVNEDIFGMKFTEALVAGRRRYQLPADMLNQIKGVELSIDGVEKKWIDEFDLNSMKRPTDEASIIANFTGLAPKFDIFDRGLWIYSGTEIVDVVDGLTLWAIVYPADITDLTVTDVDMSENPTTTSHGFPRQFHELLARRVSIAWKNGQDRPKTLSDTEMAFQRDFDRTLAQMANGNLDRTTTRTMPEDDNGQNS